MPNTVPASAPALPSANVINFSRPSNERFLPILIDPQRVAVSSAENKALQDAVRLLAMDHDELLRTVTEASTEEQQLLRWQSLGLDLTESRLRILIDVLAEARHRLATAREVARG